MGQLEKLLTVGELAERLGAARQANRGAGVNKIEPIKAQKDGLDVGNDIPFYAELGFESIEEGDLERLKWWGIFFRRHTPGYFMLRIRISNGITNSHQLRAISWITNHFGRGVADITTRQQMQLRWISPPQLPRPGNGDGKEL